MKLSIIMPIYRNSDNLRKFLNQMNDQIKKDFELVLVIDTNSDKVLCVIDEFEELKSKCKIIYNSRRRGRTKAIRDAVEVARGDYSIIASVTNHFKSSFLDNAISIGDEKGSDIIEFNSTFKFPKKFDGRIRETFDKSVKIEDHPEVIAMSYPFDFNKMYKTTLLQKIINEPSLLEVNSRFTLAFVYKALMMAKTYSTSSETLIVSKTQLSFDFNPLKLIRQWKEIFKYAEDKYSGKYLAELTYARYFHIVVFLFTFVIVSKNKVLLEKMKKSFNLSLESDFKNFFDTNIYVLRKTKEAELILNSKNLSKIKKLFKDIERK